ncbi:MAG: hypothetical protein M1835_002088 [Candelina submexicana]|nr:MAG: hypothetical protein M1835_002088 [Candelina submexicana]
MIPCFLLATWFLVLYSLQPRYASAVIDNDDIFINDRPFCDADYGFPRYCLSNLILFDRVVRDRGYGMDDPIEFTAPGIPPQHSPQFPHEELDTARYTFFFLGDPEDNHQVCVMSFDIGHFMDSHGPPSLVLSHAMMRAAAKDVMEECCYGTPSGTGGPGGFRSVIEDFNTMVDVTISSAWSFNERLRAARKITMDYRPSPSNREPPTDPPGGSGQDETSESRSDFSFVKSINGPVGPGDKGKGVASYYCNKSQSPTTCKPGFACFTKALAHQAVLWGLTQDFFYDFIGMCAVIAGSS